MFQLNWKASPEDSRDKKYSDHVPHSLVALPKLVDLASGMGPIKNQGQLGCCVGEASVAAVEFLERQYGLDANFSGSELFAYYNARRDKTHDTGAYARDSIKAMATYGVCHESMWPFIARKFAVNPDAAVYADGKRTVITDYLRASTLLDIKNALAQHHPVMLGFVCYDSLESQETARTGRVPMPKAYESVIGGHEICIVGYNDSTGYLKFKNSWGIDWGDKGYGYLPYGYVPAHSDDYWVLRK